MNWNVCELCLIHVPRFKRVRVVYGDKYRPVLKDGDHLHIYGFDTFTKE